MDNINEIFGTGLQKFIKEQGLEDDPDREDIMSAAGMIAEALKKAAGDPSLEEHSKKGFIVINQDGLCEDDDIDEYEKDDPDDYMPVNKNDDYDEYDDPSRYVWASDGNIYSREEWDKKQRL